MTAIDSVIVSQAAAGFSEAKAASQDLQTKIQQLQSKSAPGSVSSVQVKYANGTNGNLIPVGATVQTKQETASALPTNTKNTPKLKSDPLVALSPAEEVDVFGLSAEEREVIRQLQQRDLEVRNHESQHFRAAGGLAVGGSNFQYQQGPDGKNYAVGGNVDIQIGSSLDLEKSASDAKTLALAASAPADASAQDISVANAAQKNQNVNILA